MLGGGHWKEGGNACTSTPGLIAPNIHTQCDTPECFIEAVVQLPASGPGRCGNADSNDAKARGAFVIVLERRAAAAQQDARVGPEPLEKASVGRVSANQQHCRHRAALDRVQGPVDEAPLHLRPVVWV